jgi:tyrosine-protein kinase Etk/Wzc
MKKTELLSVTELVLVLQQRWKMIVGGALLGAGLAAGYALSRNDTFTATAVVMAPQQARSSALAALGQVGASTGISMPELGLRSPADLYLGILGSRTIADALIARHQLQERYQAKTMTAARKRLAAKTRLSAGKDTLIRIAVEDSDPQMAAVLANAYVDELYRQNSRLALTEASSRRLFFEKQLEGEKEALNQAEASLRKTQERTGVVQISSQMDASIRAMGQVRAEIAGREVALRSMAESVTEQNPDYVRVATELQALRGQLRRLEQNDGSRSAGDPLIPVRSMPAAGMDYLRMMREMKYHETLMDLLTRQYEAAKVDEAKQAPVLQVVDLATPPDLKSGPQRTVITLLGLVSGAVCGAAAGLLRRRPGASIHGPAASSVMAAAA